MFKKIKRIRVKAIIAGLKDVRVIGLLAFGAIAILVTWSGINDIQQNYKLQQQIVQLEQEITIQQLENENLAFKNEYYETDQYLELQARRQFGLAAPGETVLTVPDRVALEHSVPLPEETTAATIAEPEKPQYVQNLQAWADFLFRGIRQNE